MKPAYRSITSLAAAALLLACGAAEESGSTTVRKGEIVQLPSPVDMLDSVVLRDSANAFIAEPAGVAMNGAAIYVTDAGSSSVLQFDRDGGFVRRIGRRGRGPGEFSAPGAMATIGDTLLVVSDVGTGRISLFDTRTGQLVLIKRFPGAPFTISAVGDTLLGGTYDAMQINSMFRTTLNDSVGQVMGPVSPDYTNGQRVRFSYPFSAAALHTGGAIVAMVGSRRMYRTDAQGSATDSIELASRVRRGVPQDLERALADARDPASQMLLVSILTALSRIDSSTAMVHVDFSPSDRSVSGKAYLSLVNWPLHAQCVDAEIPLAPDTRPVFAFRNDTLISVQNVVTGTDSLTSYTRLQRFRVPACGSGSR